MRKTTVSCDNCGAPAIWSIEFSAEKIDGGRGSPSYYKDPDLCDDCFCKVMEILQWKDTELKHGAQLKSPK